MRNLVKSTALVLAAMVAVSGSAEAAKTAGLKDTSFTATAVGDLPTLVYKYHSGQWKLAKNGPQQTIKFHLKAKKRKLHRVAKYEIYNHSTKPSTKITHVSGFNVKTLDKVIMHKVKDGEKQPFVSQGQQICEQEGHPDKLLKKTIKPGLKYVSRIWSSTKNGSFTSGVEMFQTVPVQIVCEPQNFKVQNIKLSMKYDKQPGKCHYKVTLRAEFKTNSASTQKFDFWLYRKDGNTQKNSATAGPTGKAVFTKNYTIKSPVDRQYMVAYKNTTSKWAPMKVKCGSSSSGGFKNQTSSHNN